MYVDLHKRSVDRRTDTRPGTGRVPEETHNVHDALHKLGLCRVSSRTIFQQEEEILSMVLDFKIDVPCVVRWSLLWFSAPTDLKRILEVNWKSKSTTKSCMLTSVARVLQHTHRKRGINKEMK